MAKRLLIQIAVNAEKEWLVGFNIVPSALVRIPPNQRPSMNLGFLVIGRGKSKVEALKQAHETAKTDIICKAHGVASVLPAVSEEARGGTGTAPIPDMIQPTFRSGETVGAKPATSAPKPAPAAPSAPTVPPASGVSSTGLQPMKHTAGAIRPERGGGPIPSSVPGATRVGNR